MAMADTDYNSHGARLYILNGQPLIIRDNSNINTVSSISADILQQALHDAGTSVNDSLTVLDDSNFLSSKQNVNGRTIDKNEYVAILGGEEDADESPIHLTLEQAAELGLQFESDDQNFDPATRRTVTKQKQFIFSADPHENETLFQRNVNHAQAHTEMERNKVDSSNYGTSIGIITSQGQNDASVNQQVVFIPQIINGTVAYAVQMAGEQNEFVQESFPVTAADQNNLKTTTVLSGSENFNLTGLTSSSVLSLIQPTLTTPQVSIMSTDNSIEPILNTTQSTSSINHRPDSTEKLTTYILPSSLHVNSSNNAVTKSTNNSMPSYSHATSLQQISDTVRKQKLLNNGVTKQRSVLKSLQPSLPKELNTVDVSVDLVEPQRGASHLIINGIPDLKQFSQSEEMTVNSKEETSKDKSKELFDKCSNSTDNKITADACRTTELTMQMDTCNDEGKSTTTPTLITAEDGSVPQDVSAALTRASIKADSKKPLGSNENPIQLVQRGQTFHSVQALSQEQLKRVMTVLKQEHLDTGKSSKNILYDAESNTRIIYRVVCPEELYLQKKDDENAPKRRGRRKKNQPPSPQNNSSPSTNNTSNNHNSSSINNNSSTNNSNNMEVEDEVVPRRKQVFPRTRSGRLSRPPKHMVRDYKRIRKMDVDDSDGVYSDYHSDHDEENITPANNLLPGLSAKQKHNITTNFRCPTCGKIYLGLVRMAQHFDKYPDHGSAEYLKTLQNAHSETEGGTGDVRTVVGGTGNGIWRNGRIGRKRGRGRGSYITNLTTSHKCHKLRETLDACSEQEIVNVAGPMVASVLTAWDLLLLRIEAVREESKVAALYQELKHLLHKIRLISSKLFKPLDHQFNSTTAVTAGDAFTIDIDDDLMSYVLELPCGMYFGSDIELCSPDYQIVAQKRPRKETDPDSSAVVSDTPKNKLPKRDCKETAAHEEILSSLAVVAKSQESNLSNEEKLDNSDSNVSQPSFLLTGEEMMCDSEDRGGLDSVDEIVCERLQNLTGSSHQSQSEMLKSDVDELMKGFTVNMLDHSVVGGETGQNQSDIEPPDDLIDGFTSISSQRPHVSASTEDLIKSLEHFGSELNQPEDRTSYPSSSIDRENFPRLPNVDTLDFEVLSREFHSNNR